MLHGHPSIGIVPAKLSLLPPAPVNCCSSHFCLEISEVLDQSYWNFGWLDRSNAYKLISLSQGLSNSGQPGAL